LEISAQNGALDPLHVPFLREYVLGRPIHDCFAFGHGRFAEPERLANGGSVLLDGPRLAT
jgi:hypothetical protein